MEFRGRLLATLRAARPVLEEAGVLVLGSEVPNLLQPGAASTLVVSQDVDIGVPVAAHARVKARLREIRGLVPSLEEPSVWLPEDDELVELNFIGFDPTQRETAETYVLEDPELPLMVFGPLSLVRPGARLEIEPGWVVPLPRPSGLMLEKLLTDRSGIKGDRDLLVVLALMTLTGDDDLRDLEAAYRALAPDLRYAVQSNLTLLSLLQPHTGMPDPRPHRAQIAALFRRLEAAEGASG
jgi:hypothetical protein